MKHFWTDECNIECCKIQLINAKQPKGGQVESVQVRDVNWLIFSRYLDDFVFSLGMV